MLRDSYCLPSWIPTGLKSGCMDTYAQVKGVNGITHGKDPSLVLFVVRLYVRVVDREQMIHRQMQRVHMVMPMVKVEQQQATRRRAT